MKELITAGLAVVDKIDNKKYMGGAAVTTAINGKYVGIDTGILTAFGTDADSSHFVHVLRQSGVDIRLSSIVSGGKIYWNHIDHSNREKGWKDYGIGNNFKHLYIDYNVLHEYQSAYVASAHYDLTEKLLHQGMPAKEYLFYAPGPKVVSDDRYINKDALMLADVAFFNEAEWVATRKLFGVNTVHQMLQFGPHVVVVTLGEKGLILASETDNSDDQIISTTKNKYAESTGAGDAFALGFVIGYTHRLPVETCAKIGVTFAQSILQTTGGIMRRYQAERLRKELLCQYNVKLPV